MVGEIKNSKGKVTSFIRKLIQLLEDQSNDFIIKWGDLPNQFIVHNVPEFSSTLLPIVFKHSNYSSFVRQLNIYGFIKVKAEEHTYEHKYLDRRNPEFHHLITRKNKRNSQEVDRRKERIEDRANFQDFQQQLNSLNKKFKDLKKENKQLKKEKQYLTEQISSMRKNFNKMLGQNLLETFHQTRGINERHIHILQQILKSDDVGEWTGQAEGKEELQTMQILKFIVQQKIYTVEKVKIVIELFLEGTDANEEQQFQVPRYLPEEILQSSINYSSNDFHDEDIDQFIN